MDDCQSGLAGELGEPLGSSAAYIATAIDGQVGMPQLCLALRTAQPDDLALRRRTAMDELVGGALHAVGEEVSPPTPPSSEAG